MTRPEQSPAVRGARRPADMATSRSADVPGSEDPARAPAQTAVPPRSCRSARSALQCAADRFTRPSRACFAHQFLDEFHIAFEPLVDAVETELTPLLRDAGASADLLHEWALVVAALQDFLPALAHEIERKRSGD